MLMEEKFFFNLAEKKSLFWSPDYLDNSAWTEHIPFAFWLVEVLKPKRIVELGIHNGNSYFAFCQAVKQLNINTVCYGVDTWEGDVHAGFYDEDVFAKVTNHNNLKYSGFSTLIRSAFDVAKDYFIDHTIDLLHIDGLHTYEVVKHDFESWLPKLTPDAFVIFHDINVRERDFGVFKFWEELKQQYKHFHFDFGHGLGVIALGNIFQDELKYLATIDTNDIAYLFMRNFFSERGNFFKTGFEKDAAIEQKRKEFEAHAAQINQECQSLTLINNELAENHKKHELAYNELKNKRNEIFSAHHQLSDDFKSLQFMNSNLEAAYKNILKENEEQESDINFIKNQHEASETALAEKLNGAQQTIADFTSSIIRQQNTIEELQKTIKHHHRTIDWYKRTYEERTILGALKEKLKAKFKKKIATGQSVAFFAH